MENKYERSEKLLGTENFNKLRDKTICVIGLGGVGGTALIGLARSGFKKFILLDGDIVSPSNLNRQILYFDKDISSNKVNAAKEHLLNIDTSFEIEAIAININSDNIHLLDKYNIDFIVDAIDDMPGKIALAQYALSKHIPFISSLGMANRLDPSQVNITRLDKTTLDPLARKMRYEIKKSGLDTKDIYVVYSKEVPIKEGKALYSMMGVPSSAGLNIAYYVINYFVKIN